MSQNNKFYVEKMEQLRASHLESRPTRKVLVELSQFVRECEAAWDLKGQVGCSGEGR